MTTTPYSEEIEPDGPSEKTMWMVFLMMGLITIIGVTTIITLVAIDTKAATNTNAPPPVHPGGQP